ncbi:hypothetical protein HELRODRAFT_169365 [Helobdella robusta]|uniref:Uncharacterized protein n=1 Tax=Helobdella robusta TaxID=6412 RepID=T1F1U7_HELRO|nr:hypothetical protein HELRODRAFT_169365 [Helobdella robusta]ESO08506.1 hypothetical protein HELRODRAFT_169365 [Helobdella robusta]
MTHATSARRSNDLTKTGDVERHKKELNEVERSLNEIRNDTTKLSTLIVKERGSGESMQQEHKVAIKKYEASLNDAERELIELEGRLEMMKEERGRLCDAIMEAEKQMMLWDKKIQLAQEARDSVDGEEVRSEVGSLRNEIHRMEVRLQQLIKECEKKCLQMERLVACREVNLVKGEAMKTRSETVIKKTMMREVTELKRRIKERNKEADNFDKEMKQLQEEQERLNEKFESERRRVRKLQEHSQQLDQQLQQAFVDTLVGQHKIKNFQQQQQSKTTSTTLQVEYRKKLDRMQSIVRVLNKLTNEFPEASADLRKVMLTYGSKCRSFQKSSSNRYAVGSRLLTDEPNSFKDNFG